MAPVNLKRLIHKKGDTASAVVALAQIVDPSISIQDPDGRVLFGAPAAGDGEKHPVEFDGETLGWVAGGEDAGRVAALLAQLAAKESEKKSLANEVLGLYREVNLLYNLSEKLAASLELSTVALLALTEASSLIAATDGSVMLFNEESGKLESVATFGGASELQNRLVGVRGIIAAVVQGGKAEIVNEVASDARYVQGETEVRSLVVAPLKAKQLVIGVIILMSATPVAYTAADLKLLHTLASQAGPAIESALLYEKTLREAKEREERLQRQIEQLRIELDEALLTKRVEEITESDYFQRLREQAEGLRKSIGGEV
jgi:putative methionine-R-sulfoxide reductase with GAF domain